MGIRIDEAIKHYEGHRLDREVIVTVTDSRIALAALRTMKWIDTIAFRDETLKRVIHRKFQSYLKGTENG